LPVRLIDFGFRLLAGPINFLEQPFTVLDKGEPLKGDHGGVDAEPVG
jgi:hypothetical protein